VTINRFQRPVTQLLLCHMPLPLLMVRWFAESASVWYSRDFGSGKVHNCVLLETGHYRGASVRWGDRPSSLYHVQCTSMYEATALVVLVLEEISYSRTVIDKLLCSGTY
jgi:hypothetical protein